jgi:hypothetical protein
METWERRQGRLCSIARYRGGILPVKQDNFLKCCCEWQAGRPKWEGGAAVLRDNCKIELDTFSKGERRMMQKLNAK